MTGLSIGIACSFLIALYIHNEATYDTFNVKRDRIYDVVLNFRTGGQEFITDATTSFPLGPVMLNEFPETHTSRPVYWYP
jgi:putative ABC transport system permease protein